MEKKEYIITGSGNTGKYKEEFETIDNKGVQHSYIKININEKEEIAEYTCPEHIECSVEKPQCEGHSLGKKWEEYNDWEKTEEQQL